MIAPLILTGVLIAGGCSGARSKACPEERLVACLKTLAQTHTAFQAGWTAEDLSWPLLRRAALESCGCDSTAFENSLRQLLMSQPEKLEGLFTDAMKEEG